MILKETEHRERWCHSYLQYFSFCSFFAWCQKISPLLSYHLAKGTEYNHSMAGGWRQCTFYSLIRFTFTCCCWGLVPGKAVTSTTAAMCFEWAEHWSISQRERGKAKESRSGEREREWEIESMTEETSRTCKMYLIEVSLLQKEYLLFYFRKDSLWYYFRELFSF